MLFWCVVHNLEMIHFHNLFITHTHTSFLSWSMLHITPCILLTKIRRCQSSTPHRKRHHSIAYILPKTELPCNIQFIPSKGHQLVDVMPLTDRMNKKKFVAIDMKFCLIRQTRMHWDSWLLNQHNDWKQWMAKWFSRSAWLNRGLCHTHTRTHTAHSVGLTSSLSPNGFIIIYCVCAAVGRSSEIWPWWP